MTLDRDVSLGVMGSAVFCGFACLFLMIFLKAFVPGSFMADILISLGSIRGR